MISSFTWDLQGFLEFFPGFVSLRILGPSNGGVGTCIAGVRVLKIGTFEGSGYLGLMKKNEKHVEFAPWDFFLLDTYS